MFSQAHCCSVLANFGLRFFDLGRFGVTLELGWPSNSHARKFEHHGTLVFDKCCVQAWLKCKDVDPSRCTHIIAQNRAMPQGGCGNLFLGWWGWEGSDIHDQPKTKRVGTGHLMNLCPLASVRFSWPFPSPLDKVKSHNRLQQPQSMQQASCKGITSCASLRTTLSRAGPALRCCLTFHRNRFCQHDSTLGHGNVLGESRES